MFLFFFNNLVSIMMNRLNHVVRFESLSKIFLRVALSCVIFSRFIEQKVILISQFHNKNTPKVRFFLSNF